MYCSQAKICLTENISPFWLILFGGAIGGSDFLSGVTLTKSTVFNMENSQQMSGCDEQWAMLEGVSIVAVIGDTNDYLRLAVSWRVTLYDILGLSPARVISPFSLSKR